MKKTKLTVALMTALLSVGTLAGCDYYATYSPKGNLVTYKIGDEERTITADDILKEYYNDSSKYQSMFDAIKSIIVRNYFTITEEVTLPDGKKVQLGAPQLGDLMVERDRKVQSDEYQATLNAKNNNSTFDKEFDAILSSKGVETREELEEKYLDELKSSKFDDNYYTYHLSEIKKGSEDPELTKYWSGYFNDMLPYHVSHILVKLDDSGSTNYYNGTISEDNCRKLYDVVNALGFGLNKFGMIAKNYSEDTGSAAKYGDLGIMDFSTSFVPEFKLGVYAYENLYGKLVNGIESKINIPEELDIKENYINYTNASFDSDESTPTIPTVNFKVFEDLFSSRKQTKSQKKDTEGNVVDEYNVMEGSALVYPRNIIYNENLNRHSFAFVTNDEANEERFVDSQGALVEGTTGFHNYGEMFNNENILSVVVAGEYRPVLMVRAGTSEYQGIHFIVVNRDAFTETDANNVTKDEYYTTYHMNQDGYPKDSNGNPKQTYVNFNSELGGQDSNSRADSFVSTLKSFDSDKLSKFIFKKYMKKENVVISDANLTYSLEKWIDNNLEVKDKETKESWKTTWKDYIATLRKQKDEREKLITPLARIGFEEDVKTRFVNKDGSVNTAGKDLFKYYVVEKYELVEEKDFEQYFQENVLDMELETFEDLYNVKGALCNDGKEHK